MKSLDNKREAQVILCKVLGDTIFKIAGPEDRRVCGAENCNCDYSLDHLLFACSGTANARRNIMQKYRLQNVMSAAAEEEICEQAREAGTHPSFP